jgi:hypothetical protein
MHLGTTGAFWRFGNPGPWTERHEQNSMYSFRIRRSSARNTAASAGLPVALIEQLSGNPVGLENYLETGRVIRLGTRETVVLSYLASCTREAITGGTVRWEPIRARYFRARCKEPNSSVIEASFHLQAVRQLYKSPDARLGGLKD